jgi:hypothetical protein
LISEMPKRAIFIGQCHSRRIRSVSWATTEYTKHTKEAKVEPQMNADER